MNEGCIEAALLVPLVLQHGQPYQRLDTGHVGPRVRSSAYLSSGILFSASGDSSTGHGHLRVVLPRSSVILQCVA